MGTSFLSGKLFFLRKETVDLQWDIGVSAKEQIPELGQLILKPCYFSATPLELPSVLYTYGLGELLNNFQGVNHGLLFTTPLLLHLCPALQTSGHISFLLILKYTKNFSGGSGVESLPANAGDTGLTPPLGRFHMQRGN